MATITLSWAPTSIVMATTSHYHDSHQQYHGFHHSNTITCSHVVAKLGQEVSFKLAQVPSLFYDTDTVCALELLRHFLYMHLHYTAEEHSVAVREQRRGLCKDCLCLILQGNIVRFAAPCANISIMWQSCDTNSLCWLPLSPGILQAQHFLLGDSPSSPQQVPNYHQTLQQKECIIIACTTEDTRR